MTPARDIETERFNKAISILVEAARQKRQRPGNDTGASIDTGAVRRALEIARKCYNENKAMWSSPQKSTRRKFYIDAHNAIRKAQTKLENIIGKPGENPDVVLIAPLIDTSTNRERTAVLTDLRQMQASIAALEARLKRAKNIAENGVRLGNAKTLAVQRLIYNGCEIFFRFSQKPPTRTFIDSDNPELDGSCVKFIHEVICAVVEDHHRFKNPRATISKVITRWKKENDISGRKFHFGFEIEVDRKKVT